MARVIGGGANGKLIRLWGEGVKVATGSSKRRRLRAALPQNEAGTNDLSLPSFLEFSEGPSSTWELQEIRSGKLQNESFPNFSNFRPESCPEFCSEFSPNFSRTFRASFRGRRRPEKFTKNPRHFSMQNSQANTKKIFTNFFWRAGRVTRKRKSFSSSLWFGSVRLRVRTQFRVFGSDGSSREGPSPSFPWFFGFPW